MTFTRALVLATALAGCHSAPAPSTPPINKAPPPSPEQVAHDPLAFLPPDAEVVIDVDFTKLRASPRWADAYYPLLTKFSGGSIVELGKRCGVDFVGSTTRFTMGFKVSTTGFIGVVVLRGPDAAAALTCYDRPEAHPVHDGDTLVLTGPNGHTAAFRAVADRTLVIEAGSGVNSRTLGDRIAAGVPIRSSTEVATRYAHIDPAAAIAVIGNGASTAFESVRSTGFVPRWFDLAVTMTDTYNLVLHATMVDATSATKLVDLIVQNRPMIERSVVQHDVRANGAGVTLSATLDAQMGGTALAYSQFLAY